ncbi:PQQ-binding-like beta-propeller repeat protein [Nocardia sp. NPDC127526]|uniref:outer membrane protein assembly factor BamB family protein n=1 Tax=Nocardia sp. NPDC127526 TaxID=3345393 RepID=UPI0036263BE9
MTTTPGLRGLVFAAIAAVLTSAGAVAVLMQPADPLRKITGTNDAAPGLAWSVDATALLGAAAAEFRSPLHGTEFDFGDPGLIRAGATLVTVAGIADEDSSLRDATMFGIDADTGRTRWRAPAANLGGCAAVPLDGELVCFANSPSDSLELVGYDLDTGIVARTRLDWYPFALAVTDGRLFIAEGDVESDDVRVHSGTRADPDRYWSHQFAMGAGWEDLPFDALDVTHGQGLFALGADIAGFDLTSGATTWTTGLDGCSRFVVTEPGLTERVNITCPDYHVTGTDVFDRTGRIIATTDHTATHTLTLDEPTDDAIPLLLADTARDRRDGAIRWTNPDLLYSEPEADGSTIVRGAAIAVLDDTAILRDPFTRTTSGLDLRTGETLWRKVAARDGTLRAHGAGHAVFSDATGLWSLDLRTGETRWDIPYLAINSDPAALTDPSMIISTGTDRFALASDRTLLGLRPFS